MRDASGSTWGVESGSQDILDELKKGISLGTVRKVFRAARKLGFETLAYFMLGCPGDSRKTIEDTIGLSIEVRPTYANFTILTPYPATELYLDLLRSGRYETDYWREFARDPTSKFKVPVIGDNLSQQELIGLLKHAYKRFYMRPSYVLSQLLTISSFQHLENKFRQGLSLMKL